MAKNKTLPTISSLKVFPNRVKDIRQRRYRYKRPNLVAQITGGHAFWWGSGMPGFGSCHYRYASGREGNMMAVEYSCGKGSLLLCTAPKSSQSKPLLSFFGMYKSGKSSVYINRLSDLSPAVLGKIIFNTYQNLAYTTNNK